MEDFSDTRHEELPKKSGAREGVPLDESLQEWETFKIIGRRRVRQITAIYNLKKELADFEYT